MNQEEFSLSPSIAICLDAFGQVVAHRVTLASDIRWLGSRKRGREHGADVPHDKRHHGGRRIDEWELQNVWRIACKLHHGDYPRRIRLSPATQAILNALDQERDQRKSEELDVAKEASRLEIGRWLEEHTAWDRRRPLEHRPHEPKRAGTDCLAGKANHLAIAQAGFLTVMGMLDSGNWGGRPMTKMFASLVVWLHCAPWYVENEDAAGRSTMPEHFIEEWCFRSFKGQGPDAVARETARFTRDYRLWIKRGGYCRAAGADRA